VNRPVDLELAPRVEPPDKRTTLALIRAVSGTLVIAGLAFAYLERRYAPNAIVTDDSIILPPWIGWMGYLFTLSAAVTYNVTDYVEWWGRRR